MIRLLQVALVAALAAAPVLANTTLGENYFGMSPVQTAGQTLLELDLVVASGPGTVEIYDAADTGLQRLLGSEPVRAGANTDIKVSIVPPPVRDAVAVLRVDGTIVAQQRIEIRRRSD